MAISLRSYPSSTFQLKSSIKKSNTQNWESSFKKSNTQNHKAIESAFKFSPHVLACT